MTVLGLKGLSKACLTSLVTPGNLILKRCARLDENSLFLTHVGIKVVQHWFFINYPTPQIEQKDVILTQRLFGFYEVY